MCENIFIRTLLHSCSFTLELHLYIFLNIWTHDLLLKPPHLRKWLKLRALIVTAGIQTTQSCKSAGRANRALNRRVGDRQTVTTERTIAVLVKVLLLVSLILGSLVGSILSARTRFLKRLQQKKYYCTGKRESI